MSNQSARALSHAPRLAGAIGILLLAAACGGNGSSTAEPASSSGATAAAQTDKAAVRTAVTGRDGFSSTPSKDLSGGLWWVVAPSGKWITKSGSSSGSASKTPAGRYGGSGY